MSKQTDGMHVNVRRFISLDFKKKLYVVSRKP